MKLATSWLARLYHCSCAMCNNRNGNSLTMDFTFWIMSKKYSNAISENTGLGLSRNFEFGSDVLDSLGKYLTNILKHSMNPPKCNMFHQIYVLETYLNKAMLSRLCNLFELCYLPSPGGITFTASFKNPSEKKNILGIISEIQPGISSGVYSKITPQICPSSTGYFKICNIKKFRQRSL